MATGSGSAETSSSSGAASTVLGSSSSFSTCSMSSPTSSWTTTVPPKPCDFIRATASGQSASSTRRANADSSGVMFCPSSLSRRFLIPRSKLANSPPAAAPIAIHPTGPKSAANRMPITPPFTKPWPMLSSFVCWILILPFSVFVIATASLSLTTPSLAISLTVASASRPVSTCGYLITRKLYCFAMALPYSARWNGHGQVPPYRRPTRLSRVSVPPRLPRMG